MTRMPNHKMEFQARCGTRRHKGTRAYVTIGVQVRRGKWLVLHPRKALDKIPRREVDIPI